MGQSARAPVYVRIYVCEWVHLMNNDASCWKSVYETKQFELNSNLGK